MSSSVLGKCYFFLLMVSSCGASKSVKQELTLESCPQHCVCSESANAVRVDCLNRNLTAVPQDIGTKTTILDLSWNAITELNGNEFCNVSRLEELNLANNVLETIPDSEFLNLLALHTLHVESNQLRSIPSKSFKPLLNLEKLHLASNNIQSIPDQAFMNLRKLTSLYLQRNVIEFVGLNAFEGLVSLKVLEINGNQLLEIPQALISLPNLREFSFSDNKIRYLSKSCFVSNRGLTSLELSGNPLESFEKSTFAYLPHLKKLVLSEIRLLEDFPEITGTSALEHLRIDRANLHSIPDDICTTVPLLRSLNFKSNQLTDIPSLRGCLELRLIDLSYNSIRAIEDYAFMDQENLIDLFLGHNLISTISKNAFHGMVDLQVLDLESNKIEDIHQDAFMHFKELRDLNLGANKFPKLPTKGLQNLRQLKTFNNRELKEFPPVRTFPRINTLALSYAYHCCEFIALSAHKTSKSSTSLQETIVWLSKDDVDLSAWNSNISDILPESSGNFSTKFEELANQLWKTFGRDYTIPDNLAQYAEEYFESAFNHDENSFASGMLQCLPEPGPFMPCEDLFGWWSLRCGVWVVFLLALLGNAVVVIVLIIRRSKMDVPRFLVCNLAGADFCMGVYLGILAVVDASTLGEFKVSAIKFQTSFGCKLAGFFGVFSSELSVFTLSIITLERNYAITHAMHLNKRLSLRHAGYIMFIGWTFATVMAILPLLGISDYSKFAICLPFETKDVLSLTYVVFLILINGVAFLILMGCYLKMYCAIRGSQAWNSNDSRIAKRMALLVFTDFICWSPIAFFSLTAVCGLQLISLEEAKVFAIFVLPLNSCANPFLYAIFTKQFKKDCIHICKRIEESRVTRGIGRGRHSSNFSNRHTPVTTNSAAAMPGSDSEPQRYRILSTDVCHCNKASWKLKNSPQKGWKDWALKYFLCRRKETEQNDPDSYTYAISQIQKNMEKRNKHITSISSENFSSRSDSWRQGNIPLRLMDHETRRGSWSLERKASEDSNISCSRQDSSTSTFHISRSSFSSESSSQSRSTRPLLVGIPNKEFTKKPRENKPKLCRQGAVSDERCQTKNEFPRQLLKERNIDGLCPVCAKKVGFKSKELEEKFACFYNKLVESSYGESSDVYSSKKDQTVVSSGPQSFDEKLSSNTEKLSKSTEDIHKSNSSVNSMVKSLQTTLSKQITSQNDDKQMHQYDCYLDTKDEESLMCRSLVNVNMEVSDESSTLGNSHTPFSSKKFPFLIRSFASHESFNEQKNNYNTKQNMLNILRSSKSENIVDESTKRTSPMTGEFNNSENKSESASNYLLCSLLTPIAKQNDAKKSTSSPNIIKNSEMSLLVENKEE